MKSEMSARLVTAALMAFSLSACNDDPMSAGPATQIVISAPSNAVVGDYLDSLTVELRDANGNVATGNTDMVTIAMSTDPSGVASAFQKHGVLFQYSTDAGSRVYRTFSLDSALGSAPRKLDRVDPLPL